MSSWVQAISDWLWGPPMLILVLGTGGYLLVRLRAIQFRLFGRAVRDLLHRDAGREEGDISPFAALMTAVGVTRGGGIPLLNGVNRSADKTAEDAIDFRV